MNTLSEVMDGLEAVIDYEADKKAKEYFIDYLVGKDWQEKDITKSIARLSELMGDAPSDDIELVIFYMFMALVEKNKLAFNATVWTDSDLDDGYMFELAEEKDIVTGMEGNKSSIILNTDGGYISIDLIKKWRFK